MAGKHRDEDYRSIYNLTKDNLGPFNHTNIISGYLKVKSEISNISLGLHQEHLEMADYIQNQTDYPR